jgi:hypothetical protein
VVMAAAVIAFVLNRRDPELAGQVGPAVAGE